MESFWLAVTQLFWWTVFVISSVSFVVLSIVFVCMALHLKKKEELAETK